MKFTLLTEAYPFTTGTYWVKTSLDRVVECYYENFLGNHIWETDLAELDEEVIGWCKK